MKEERLATAQQIVLERCSDEVALKVPCPPVVTPSSDGVSGEVYQLGEGVRT